MTVEIRILSTSGSHGVFVEDPSHKITPVYLSDDAYGEALQAFVIVCTDVIIYNKAKRTIYLAKRSVKPMDGLWIIGGRMQAGEKALESMTRCFKRETSLDISPDRFHPISTNEYLWKDRKQPPQDAGSHNLAFTFGIQLTDEEITAVSLSLNPSEYDAEAGLRAFNSKDLKREGKNIHPVIHKLYRELFCRCFLVRWFFAVKNFLVHR